VACDNEPTSEVGGGPAKVSINILNFMCINVCIICN